MSTDPGIPAQPMLPGQPDFAGQPMFPGQPFPGQPFPGRPFSGFPSSARRMRRAAYASPGTFRAGRGSALVVVVVALVVMAIVIGVFVNMAHSFGHLGPSDACVGGPVSGSAGQPVGNGDVRFPCSGGGSVTIHVGN